MQSRQSTESKRYLTSSVTSLHTVVFAGDVVQYVLALVHNAGLQCHRRGLRHAFVSDMIQRILDKLADLCLLNAVLRKAPDIGIHRVHDFLVQGQPGISSITALSFFKVGISQSGMGIIRADDLVLGV